MRSTPLLLTLALPLIVLNGCTHMGIHEERIRVRRDPEIVEKEEARIRPGDYEAFLIRMQDEADARRLTQREKEEHAWYENTRHGVGAITASIPEDPWASYEKDRLETLHRNWADADSPPPEPEKEVLEEAAAAEDEEEEEGDEDDEEYEDDEDDWGDDE